MAMEAFVQGICPTFKAHPCRLKESLSNLERAGWNLIGVSQSLAKPYGPPFGQGRSGIIKTGKALESVNWEIDAILRR